MKFNEIKQTLAEHKQELKDKFKVKEIGVFGSYMRDKETNKRRRTGLRHLSTNRRIRSRNDANGQSSDGRIRTPV